MLDCSAKEGPAEVLWPPKLFQGGLGWTNEGWTAPRRKARLRSHGLRRATVSHAGRSGASPRGNPCRANALRTLWISIDLGGMDFS